MGGDNDQSRELWSREGGGKNESQEQARIQGTKNPTTRKGFPYSSLHQSSAPFLQPTGPLGHKKLMLHHTKKQSICPNSDVLCPK